MNLRNTLLSAGAALALAAPAASAAPTIGSNLVKNGTFENSTSNNNIPYYGAQMSYNGIGQFMDPTTTPYANGAAMVTLADWTLQCLTACDGGGWAFVVDKAIDDRPTGAALTWPPTNASQSYGAPYIMTDPSNPLGNNLHIWGPDKSNGPVANGFTESPNGGKWIMIDGDFGRSAIHQTITGLDTSKTYQLSFEYAGAQQAGFRGPTSQKWIVTYNGASVDVGPWINPDQGFTPWKTETFTFQPTSSTFDLAFEAYGSLGSGLPPMLMLDNVAIFETVPGPSPTPGPDPAPGPLPLLGAGAAFGWSRRIRRNLKEALTSGRAS